LFFVLYAWLSLNQAGRIGNIRLTVPAISRQAPRAFWQL
jgi:hypothetical protein